MRERQLLWAMHLNTRSLGAGLFLARAILVRQWLHADLDTGVLK